MFKTYVNASAGVSGPGGMHPITAPSHSAGAAPGGWTPGVLYMLVLIAAEITLVGFLTKHLG